MILKIATFSIANTKTSLKTIYNFCFYTFNIKVMFKVLEKNIN